MKELSMFITLLYQRLFLILPLIVLIFFKQRICMDIHEALAQLYIEKKCHIGLTTYLPVIRPMDKMYNESLPIKKYPSVKILRKEKYCERFGTGFTVALTEDLGITGKAPELLPTSDSMDLLSECQFINYYQQIQKPSIGCLVAYTNTKNIIQQCAIITNISENPLQCRVKMKAGTEPYITEHDLFNIPNVYGDFAYFFERKEEFKSNQLMLACLQKSISQSTYIQSSLKQLHELFLATTRGENVTIDGNCNQQPSFFTKIVYLTKYSMGLNLNVTTSEGKTPLILLAENNNIDIKSVNKITVLLLNMGALVNHQDNAGNTALHYAAAQDKKDLVNILLDYDADETIKNNKGQVAQLDPETAEILYHQRHLLFSLLSGGKLTF